MEISKVVYSVCAIGSFLSLLAYASFNNPGSPLAPNPAAVRPAAPSQVGGFAGGDPRPIVQDPRFVVTQDPRFGNFSSNEAELRTRSPNDYVIRNNQEGSDAFFYGQMSDGRMMYQDPRFGNMGSNAAEFRARSPNEYAAKAYVGADGYVYGQMSDGRMMYLDPIIGAWFPVQNYQTYSTGYGVSPNGWFVDPRLGWYYNAPNPSTDWRYYNQQAAKPVVWKSNAEAAYQLGSDGRILF